MIKTKRRFFAAVAGFGAVAATLAALELTVRIIDLPIRRQHFDLSPLASNLRTSAKLELSHPPPVPVYQKRTEATQQVLTEVNTPAMYYREVPGLGTMGPINTTIWTQYYKPDKSIYSVVKYVYDQFGRRVVSAAPLRPVPLLFFGCSYTLGAGVAGDQTVAAVATAKSSIYQPYLFSFHGWGPNSIWQLTKTFSAADDIKLIFEKHPSRRGQSLAIYTFIDSHLNRLIGSSGLFSRPSLGWAKILPSLRLNSRDEVENRGMLADDFYWRSRFFWLLNYSRLFRSTGVELPALQSEHLDFFVRLVLEIKKHVNDQLGIKRFAVMLWPQSMLADYLIPRLHDAGIETLDYSKIDLTEYANPSRIEHDGHPSPESYRFIGKLLDRDLNLSSARN